MIEGLLCRSLPLEAHAIVLAVSLESLSQLLRYAALGSPDEEASDAETGGRRIDAVGRRNGR